MDVIIASAPNSEMLMTVTLTHEDEERYYELARASLSEKTEIPGFRKGQAPLAQVIGKFGEQTVYQEFLRIALPKTFTEAIRAKNVMPIARPDVKVTQDKPLRYDARIPVLPEISIKNYKEVKIDKDDSKVTDAELDDLLMQLRKQRSTKKEVEREASKGDMVEIDFTGFDEGGAALDKTQSKNHPLIIGDGSLVKDFEEALPGMKTGESKTFDITFPKDYSYQPFQNKKVKFEVKMNSIYEMLLPELNADFIKLIMGDNFEPPTEEHLRQSLRDDMARRKADEAEVDRRNKLIEEWLKNTVMDISPLLIEEEIDFMLEEATMNFKRQGSSFDIFKQQIEKEKGKGIRELYAAEAEKRVKIRLMLQHILKEEAITVTDSELRGVRPEQATYQRNQIMLQKLFKKFA